MAKPLEGPGRPLPAADHRWAWTPADGAAAPWYRIYHRDRFAPDGATFRRFGPLARFDHHTPPFAAPTMDPDGRAVIYLAVDLATSACEVFGEAGVAPLCSNWRVARLRPLREITTYDLDRPGAAMAIGALPALASGNENRDLTQKWARAICEDQPAAGKVEGIHYRSAYRGGRALALWDCLGEVEVATDKRGISLDLPLDHGRGRRLLLKALAGTGIPVTPVPDADCVKCLAAA
ncbi:RES family NAD+ phosphorylase [Rhodococcus sp. IEGM 1241]|uniref:RES family NAD+ phosphorylase n=1 Tax=Rhodococcus sp. IEGM 1241 TaxID=3082228 RepID=UPI002954C9C8|nr:RES family NAD+ phosphorylase [Rhodococcus sp. IEGM 1241]MDV8015712.1 RES family NAD+ phosphorylase [Rhodococcus sp. IEGM 1241]